MTPRGSVTVYELRKKALAKRHDWRCRDLELTLKRLVAKAKQTVWTRTAHARRMTILFRKEYIAAALL